MSCTQPMKPDNPICLNCGREYLQYTDNGLSIKSGGKDCSACHSQTDPDRFPLNEACDYRPDTSEVKATPVPALNVQHGGSHYKTLKIQPVEFAHANNLGFLEGSAIKYIVRHRTKGGKLDLDKAIHFLQMLREMEYPDPPEVPKTPYDDVLKNIKTAFGPG